MKYIFIDVDGTLLDHSNHKIPDSTKEALRKLKEKNHKLFICSGRAKIVADVGIDEVFDGYVASAGTHVVFNGEDIIDRPFTKKEFNRINELANKYKLDISYEGKKHAYCGKYIEKRVFGDLKRMKMFQGDYPYWCKIKEYNNEAIYKIMIDTENDNIENFNRFNEEIKGIACGSMTPNENNLSEEISPLNYSKGSGILELINKGLIKKEDTIGIGDSANDIPMFKVVDLSICMGQASQNIKKEAMIIADDVTNDGFYKVFKNLGLIE